MPKIVDHEEFRRELLTKSFDLFGRRGFQAMSIRQIASELEVSTGTLYHYFSSKEDIFRQMLYLLSGQDVVQALAQIPGSAGVADRLLILFQFLSAKESYFQNLLFLVIDWLRNGDAEIEQVVRETIGFYRAAITEHIAMGDAELGGLFLAQVVGWILLRVIEPTQQGSSQAALLARLLSGATV